MQSLESHFTYEILESGITIYRLGRFNFASVEAWMQQANADDQIALAQGLPRCSLIDIRQASYPNAYAVYRVSQFFKHYSPKLVGCSAGLVADSGVMAMLPYLMSYVPMGQVETRIFWASQEAEAIAWLEERYRQLLN